MRSSGCCRNCRSGLLLVFSLRQLVQPLSLLKLAHSHLVLLNLLLENGVLDSPALFVVLQTAVAVQALQVDPATPPNAHAVDEHRGANVNFAFLLIEITVIGAGEVVGERVEDQLQIGARRGEGHICMSFTAAVDEANLPLLKWPVSVSGVANLRLARQLPKEFVILKLCLLVGDDARHLKDEPRQLLEDGGRLKGQHRVAIGSLQGE